MDFDSYLPVPDCATIFQFSSPSVSYQESAFFCLLLMPKNQSMLLDDVRMLVTTSDYNVVEAPCIVDFHDDRPPAMVVGFKTIQHLDGTSSTYAMTFPEGCGAWDDTKLVHMKISDILMVSGPPKNELGAKKWLSMLNSYLAASPMFKEIKVASYRDIKDKWWAQESIGGAEEKQKCIELVFDVAELTMRNEAKQFATSNNKVNKSIEENYIKEMQPAIESVRSAYEKLVPFMVGPVGDRVLFVKGQEAQSVDEAIDVLVQSIRCVDASPRIVLLSLIVHYVHTVQRMQKRNCERR